MEPQLLLVGNGIQERPSLSGRAPIPPLAKRTEENFPPSNPTPVNRIRRVGWLPESAITRSGIACARAPKTAVLRKWPMSWRAFTAPGNAG